jgi:arginine utilization protein RocB
MENMKSLADQLREQLVKPKINRDKKEQPAKTDKPEKPERKVKQKELESAIMVAILNYDNSLNKSMVHVRFDEKTVRTMNQFKMATQVDVTKLVAFAVSHLFETCPELKIIIKQFIQNTEL